jgi:hypothetical protein
MPTNIKAIAMTKDIKQVNNIEAKIKDLKN